MAVDEPVSLKKLKAALSSKHGRIFVVSGPSGVGKGTVISGVLKRLDHIALSVSATTRKPRSGEIDGVHYHFLEPAEFEHRVSDNKFYEYAEYNDHQYGTLRETVDCKRTQGIDLVLEIEIKGAMQVRKLEPTAVLIYILPPSFDELDRRLYTRVAADYCRKNNLEITEPADLPSEIRAALRTTVDQRLAIARQEIDWVQTEYQGRYVLINEDIAECTSTLEAIVLAERRRMFCRCSSESKS